MVWHGMLVVLVLMALSFSEAKKQCSMTNPCADQLAQGEDFQEPEQLQSKSVAWSIDMTVAIGTITYDWLELKRRLYNDHAAGPTIIVKKGDQVTLNLINELSPAGNDLNRTTNEQNYPNTTNMHTHGLHISAEDPQDNVLVRVEPETSYQYVYDFHPHNSPGTYWYHAHVHGSTIFQVHGGLSGIIIVEDKVADMPTELASASCPLNCDKDIQLLFQPLLIFKDTRRGFGLLQDNILDYDGFKNDGYIIEGGGTLTEWLKNHIDYYTTNGQLQPKLSMKTGELYRFRMVNAGGGHTLELYITDSAGEPATDCEIREIAIDGIYLTSPREMHDGQTLLVPGSKADWLVKCKRPGTYKLASFAEGENQRSFGVIGRYVGDLMTLEVSGTNAGASFPSTLPEWAPYITDLRNVTEDQIQGRFVVEFGPSFHINREKWSNGTYYRYKMKLGEIQEWQFLNSDPRLAHPLHMHVNHFQVISYNRYTGGIGESTDDGNWYLDNIKDLDNKCYYQHGNYTGGLVPDILTAADECSQGKYKKGQRFSYGKCSVYYLQCVKGISVKRQCPDGTVFDKTTLTCRNRRYIYECGGRRKRSLESDFENFVLEHLEHDDWDSEWEDFERDVASATLSRGRQGLSWKEFEKKITEAWERKIALDSRLEFWGHHLRFERDNGGTLGYSRIGDWRDVLLVPPLANITVRFVPTDYYGDVIIHCHILDHEDSGMMMNLKVVAEGESTTAFIKSGDAYPGTCEECDRYPPNSQTTLCQPVKPLPDEEIFRRLDDLRLEDSFSWS